VFRFTESSFLCCIGFKTFWIITYASLTYLLAICANMVPEKMLPLAAQVVSCLKIKGHPILIELYFKPKWEN